MSFKEYRELLNYAQIGRTISSFDSSGTRWDSAPIHNILSCFRSLRSSGVVLKRHTENQGFQSNGKDAIALISIDLC